MMGVPILNLTAVHFVSNPYSAKALSTVPVERQADLTAIISYIYYPVDKPCRLQCCIMLVKSNSDLHWYVR